MPHHAARVLLFAPQASLPDAAAAWLLQEYGAQAPDYSGLTLVTPTPALAQALATALLKASGGALLAPRSTTLGGFIAAALPADCPTPLACRIRIAEAVGRHRKVFPGQPPLGVAEALYELFEQLAAAQLTLPDEPALIARLQAAYGAPRTLAGLSQEARIVHTLYRAFLEDLGDSAPAPARLHALAHTLAHWPQGRPLVFVGFDALSAAEAQLIGAALQAPHSAFLAQGLLEGRAAAANQQLFQRLGHAPTVVAGDAPSPRSLLLAGAFAGEGTPQARVAAATGASSAGLSHVAASDPEHEAQMADLAVRRALLAGHKRVLVVAQDRRLARRLRARLERARVPLADRGGWALSTSRAAAALNAWLDCVQLDFPFAGLLELLKSGSLDGGSDWAARLEPLAFAEGIHSGWNHWRKHAASAEEAARWEHLREARECITSLNGPHPAGRHSEGLLASLELLGLSAAFAQDAAGSQLLAVLADLHAALSVSSLQLRWAAFRALLDQALEEASFTLPASGGVQLLTLAQTMGLAADVVIVTGATSALLQGPRTPPFFNNNVRRELGLGTAEESQSLALARLLAVLQAAPEVTLLYAPGTPGEHAQPAAPLVALLAFAEACGSPLAGDAELAALAPLAEVAAASKLPAATLPPQLPAPPELAARLANKGLSAAAHQALVECPYRFYARYGLGLGDLTAPDEPPSRRDYGERVHRLLHGFHTQLPDLPPPFDGPFGAPQLPEIEAHLQQLADAVFAGDMQHRAMGNAWRQEFGRAIPWLAEQLVAGSQGSVRPELEVSREVDGLRLGGKLDRLEDSADERRVVDYKTGNVPSRKSLEAGEQVQLPHYALTVQAQAISYWDLKDEKATTLDGNALDKLCEVLALRLTQLQAGLASGQLLPAHGAPAVCGHCEYSGVCRNAAHLRTSGAAA